MAEQLAFLLQTIGFFALDHASKLSRRSFVLLEDDDPEGGPHLQVTRLPKQLQSNAKAGEVMSKNQQLLADWEQQNAKQAKLRSAMARGLDFLGADGFDAGFESEEVELSLRDCLEELAAGWVLYWVFFLLPSLAWRCFFVSQDPH